MFEKVKTVARRIGQGLGAFALTAGVASAQTTMDVSAVTDAIAAGVTAIGLIGVAFVGYRYLKKVWSSL